MWLVGVLAAAGPALAAPPATPPAEPTAIPQPVAQKMGVLILKALQPGLEVKIDGETVGTTPVPGPWTIPVGKHTVQVGADTATVVAVAGGRHTLRFGTPKAAPKQAAAPVRETKIVHTGPGFSLATAGYALGGVGVLALGAGVFFGLDANDLADQASGLDRADPSASRAQQQGLSDDAGRSAFLSNVSLGLAGAALLGGAAMLFLASDGPFNGRPVYITPTATGVNLGGSF